jgi:hypothetical protein
MIDPESVTNTALDKLPLFASDTEIAAAVVGQAGADYYRKAIIPALERSGFPGVDPLHNGRPVPLVKRFYAAYLGITAGITVAKPDGEERFGAWRRRKPRGRQPD